MATRPAATEHRRRARVTAAAVVTALVVGGVVAAVSWSGREDATTPLGPAGPVPSAAPAAAGPVPVCGFPDLTRITADGVAPEELGGTDVVVPHLEAPEGARIVDVQVSAGTAYVLTFDDEATYRVDRYDATDGSPAGGFDVPLRLDEGAESFGVRDFQVGPDGEVYLLDTLMGRRDLVRLDARGERVWTATLPTTDQTSGRLLDLYGTVLWSGDGGAAVVGVHEGAAGMHTVAADGTVLGFSDEFPGGVAGVLDDGTVVLADDGDAGLDVRGRSADGAARFALGATAGSAVLGAGGQYAPRSLDGAVSGPGGDGLLLAVDQLGLEWYTPDGVRRGVWPLARGDLENPVLMDASAGVVRDAGAYYLLGRTSEGDSLVRVTEERMAYGLRSPVKYNAGTDDFLAVLGMGAGLETGVAYGYFAAGEPPRVALTVDDAWRTVADDYLVRYQVRGDPRSGDRVAGPWQEAPLPADGGTVDLELPEARPGVYEVDAHLVEARSGDAVSGACLRYTVGAEGADLDLAGMADGAGWGGAGPLRGVQLAHALGFGSHRVQLDVTRIVLDPTAQPGPDGLDWSSLPNAAAAGPDGQAPEDPFTELRAAAALAQELDVRLVVQVGSGGAGETAAVEAGTWEGWVREIVAETARSAPGIVHWEPWNEPNATGFDDGGDYVRHVAAPFARGARAADPAVRVVGGNTLGVAVDWWAQVVEADGCATMDVVGFHPYTGLNRSWEEEGFSVDGRELDDLREVLAPCGDLPWWDTETGWWSDGVVNFWAGASDVARKLIWYRLEGIEEWTYFFSEGGWGETGNSWSAVQVDAYVKPLGAAAAATTRLLDGFEELELLDAPAPGTYAVAGRGEGGELLALWSDDLATTLRVAAADAARVELVDPYGDRRVVEVPAEGVDLPVTGLPVLVVARAGTDLSVVAPEPFGDDLLRGRAVSATSTHVPADGAPGVDASVITSGALSVRDPWRSGDLADGGVDTAPSVTVTTDGPVEIDRVAVATAGIRCCTAGLRRAVVEVQGRDGGWTTVGEVNLLHERVALLHLEPVTVTAVRVSVPTRTDRGVPVLDLNYSGVVGGPHPAFMTLETRSDYQVAVSAVQAWGPG